MSEKREQEIYELLVEFHSDPDRVPHKRELARYLARNLKSDSGRRFTFDEPDGVETQRHDPNPSIKGISKSIYR